MKKTLVLIGLLALTLYGIYFLRSAMPFMPVYGISMEPVLHSGDLITIQQIDPKQLKEGDILVYNVPLAIQERYNYPPVVAHRIIKVNEVGRLSFRTKGDNTGEDPFTVMANDVRGKVGGQYPNLGLPLLFLQSKWGIIFALACLALTALFTYSNELGRSGGWIHHQALSPVINENRRAAQSLEYRMKNTEEGIASTQQALVKFSEAVALYGQHLQSHTSAIMGLSDASQELKKGAAEQNRILGAIADRFDSSPGPRAETASQPRVNRVYREPAKGPVKDPPVTKTSPVYRAPAAPPTRPVPPAKAEPVAGARPIPPWKLEKTAKPEAAAPKSSPAMNIDPSAIRKIVKQQQEKVPGCLRNRPDPSDRGIVDAG